MMLHYIRPLVIFIIISLNLAGQNPLPKVISGEITRIENFKSKYITHRNIDIWLPEGYTTSNKYSVLYMHDGQMLYDPEQSWNKQAWNVDDVITKLLKDAKIRNVIVVGIWNGGNTRHQDYFPQKPFQRLTKSKKDTVVAQLKRAGRTKEEFRPQSDQYLKFIVKELKPYIDKNYSVYTNMENTFITGSSMGGLISWYALCEYPKIFGGAACLSTHWVGTFTPENNPVPTSFIEYLDKKIPKLKNHKIYFDCGDQTLDALYPEIQLKVDSLMKSKGYPASHWLTKYFPGEDHTEKSWHKRLDIPLNFLLGK
jgi:enterochelin esterase-like enzyme